ncbi:N-formylglutamate deformylase [Leeia oryzae]|uniref:N-formylglutamate deformylase n=1 Tax=Leeia oryzae TaxID=356662 RepID=UPI000365C6FA|nr:N-formylglutamate deformylase [Leeia oryzae]
MNTPVFSLHQGSIPLLISMPHVGTEIPADILAQMEPVAQHLDDTDWHLPRLYDFAIGMGASVLIPTYSRYVVDLNRPSDNANLYPGQDTTSLCPVDTFHKAPLYATGNQPTEAEIQRRVGLYWQPYHQALQQEVARLKALHGRVCIWEAHSILSHVPRFFEGQLPDFNFGTLNGNTCKPGLGEALLDVVSRYPAYTGVLNGRFKGGQITRAYGKPDEDIHSIQLELSQATYMQESRPYPYLDEKASQVQPVIQDLLTTCLQQLA